MKKRILLAIATAVGLWVSCTESADKGSKWLSVERTSYEAVNPEGEVISIPVQCRDKWTATANSTWCLPYNTQGSNGDMLTLQATANITGQERTATVTLSAEGEQVTIELRQSTATTTSAEEYHYTLPVVFHVLYENSDNPLEYADPSRLYTILEAVNRLYGDRNDGEIDLNVSFVPAEIGPDGKALDTPGVEYIRWPWSYPISCTDFMSESTGRYTDYIWDPNLYVNIMLYTFEQTDGESDILGISHMPYSVQGTDAPEGLNEVGRTFLQKSNLLYPYSVSINNRYLYASSASDNIISTLAHELGHYLGLYHVFAESEDGEQNLCIDSDYCTDTPTYNRTEYMLWVLTTAQDASFAVQAQRVNCQSGESYTSRNIMDYAYGYTDSFTSQQRERVRYVLSHSPLIPGPKVYTTAGVRTAGEGKLQLPIRTMK